MPDIAHGAFAIELVPGQAELGGQVSHMDFAKTLDGDLAVTGHGLMLSAGDPSTGTAGHVAIETVDGQLHNLAGGFALQQFGTMNQGTPTLKYRIVLGSGRGALQRISGELELTIKADGTHRYALRYQL